MRKCITLSDTLAARYAFGQYEQMPDVPSRAAFRAAFRRAVREELTERQRAALIGAYIEGKTQRQLAAEWGVDPSAVCRHISRARRKLNRLLAYNLEYREREEA